MRGMERGGDARHEPETLPGGLAAASPGVRELLQLATELALAAGQAHTDGNNETLRLATKSSPTDLVSQVDQQAERLIVERLAAVRPDDAVLAEEGGHARGGSGVRWIIDPLDGTTNYVYGYPAYCVSIGVEIDERPQIGVIYDSSSGRLYQAAAGHGAFCDGRPLQARAAGDLAHALVATGFSYVPARRALQGAAVSHLLSRVRDIRRGGSAALDLCHVAAGHVDAFYELYLNPWDFAAGAVIAREAGAEVRLLEVERETAAAEPAHAERDAAAWRGPAVVAAPPALMPTFLALLRQATALVAC